MLSICHLEPGAQLDPNPGSGKRENNPDPGMEAKRGSAREKGTDVAAKAEAGAVAHHDAADDGGEERPDGYFKGWGEAASETGC